MKGKGLKHVSLGFACFVERVKTFHQNLGGFIRVKCQAIYPKLAYK
jgi:hypothetical protein